MGNNEKARSDLEVVLRTEPDDNEVSEALKELQEQKPPSAESTSSASISVPMRMEGGTYVVPVLINGAITLDFVVDSGAADVSVPADVFSTLIRTGTIRPSDFVGRQTYVLGDGTEVPSLSVIYFSNALSQKSRTAPSCSDLLNRDIAQMLTQHPERERTRSGC
jgi:hypothetical protein